MDRFKPGNPALTSRDTMLVPITIGYGTPGFSSTLLEVGPDAGMSQCVMGTGDVGVDYIQTALLPDGHWITVRWGTWFTVEGYQLMNVAPATSGWVNPNGSTRHANRPR